jgi:hypothetical protein
MDLPVLAGVISTVLFAISTLPMLHKAFRTRDLTSYSAGNIAVSNAGNAFHSVYVFSLPVGPIWFLHCFYVASSGLMLIWYLRYRTDRPGPTGREHIQAPPVLRTRGTGRGVPPTQLAELEPVP